MPQEDHLLCRYHRQLLAVVSINQVNKRIQRHSTFNEGACARDPSLFDYIEPTLNVCKIIHAEKRVGMVAA